MAVLWICGSFIQYKTKVKGVADNVGYFPIFKCFFQLSDLFTDLFFNIILYLKNEMPILTYISIASMLLSYFGSICICVIWFIRWKLWQDHVAQRLHKYLAQYGVLLMGLTILSNFYVSVDVLRSKLFYHNAFYFPLTKCEYKALNKYKFVNITLSENMGQFLIQILYLLNIENISDVNSIVLISIVFRAFSIFFSIMKFCVNDNESKINSLEEKFGGNW